jgi:hypothetical protein
MKIPMAHDGNVSEKPTMGMQWVQKYHWSMRNLILSIFCRYTNLHLIDSNVC